MSVQNGQWPLFCLCSFALTPFSIKSSEGVVASRAFLLRGTARGLVAQSRAGALEDGSNNKKSVSKVVGRLDLGSWRFGECGVCTEGFQNRAFAFLRKGNNEVKLRWADSDADLSGVRRCIPPDVVQTMDAFRADRAAGPPATRTCSNNKPT